MQPADRRTHLLVSHLEKLAERKNSDDDFAIRKFLCTWRRVTGTGNHQGATLMVRVMPKQPNQAIVFAVVPGVGPVPKIPVLTVPWSDRFHQIMRECGERPLFTYERERKTDVWGQPVRTDRPVLPEVTIKLLVDSLISRGSSKMVVVAAAIATEDVTEVQLEEVNTTI